jgi:thiamine phosphate synthase YjbQ (UPF0047 family)
MTAHTVYRTFHTDRRREFVRITDDVAESGIQEGMVLVSAMHITAGVWINDARTAVVEGASYDVAAGLGPDPGDFRHAWQPCPPGGGTSGWSSKCWVSDVRTSALRE